MWSISTILLQTVWEATWGVWGRKGRVEAGPPRANPAGSWAPRGCLSKQLGGPHSFGHYVRGGKNSRKPSHTAPSLAPWLELQHGMRAPFTFAVSIIIDLDFGSSEAGISMQLTVVEVGLAIAATHRPLVRFALLKQIVEDAGTVKAESVCAPHIHTHTHTHTHTAILWGVLPSRDDFYPARAQGASALASVTLPYSVLEGLHHLAVPHGALCRSWPWVISSIQWKEIPTPWPQSYQISRKGILSEVRNLDYLSLYHFVESHSMSGYWKTP